jgi:hypothetical protein
LSARPERPTEAKRWQLDGLRLPGEPPALGPRRGDADFRAALVAARAARPDGHRPEPAELRRWGRALQKAARVAPDERTQKQLRRVAGYVLKLARTDADERADLQRERPEAIRTAIALRANLSRRFGSDLLS